MIKVEHWQLMYSLDKYTSRVFCVHIVWHKNLNTTIAHFFKMKSSFASFHIFNSCAITSHFIKRRILFDWYWRKPYKWVSYTKESLGNEITWNFTDVITAIKWPLSNNSMYICTYMHAYVRSMYTHTCTHIYRDHTNDIRQRLVIRSPQQPMIPPTNDMIPLTMRTQATALA